MLADADLARIGQMFGDRHRAAFLLALSGGEELAAGELAARTGASSSLASTHLAKLLDAGLVATTRCGRHRYYRLARPEVARAIETALAISPPQPARGLRESNRGEAIQRARTCYDHLAGRLGVSLAEALEQRRILTAHDGGFQLTSSGERQLAGLGLDIPALRRQRRTFVRPCLDWSERRPHLAGTLGAALAARMFELGWIRRLAGTRAVRLTPAGADGLEAAFSLAL